MSDQRTRLVVGCMTGTSLDGLDVALVKIIGTGLEMQAELLGHHALAMPDDLRSVLMSLASGEPNEPITIMQAARDLGELHADGIEQLLTENNNTQPDFITAHGQTIWHAPGSKGGSGAGMSWQLFDPWPIVKRLKRPVCYDLRQADLVAGGEGAPLTPIADWVMYRDKADWVVNLGGVLNYTTWPSRDTGIDQIAACDLCWCNLLLDSLAHELTGEPYDVDGIFAQAGELNNPLGDMIESSLKEASERATSLGREDLIRSEIVQRILNWPIKLSPEDVLLTTVLAIVECFSEAYHCGGAGYAVLAGGGVRNSALRIWMQRMPGFIRNARTNLVVTSDALGIPCEAREAMAFAVLGALSQDGVPISLPQVTGATNPGVAGVWAGL